MPIEQDIAELVQASNNLTGVVDGKVQEIDSKVLDAKQKMNSFIGESKSAFVNQKHFPNNAHAVKIWRIGIVDFAGQNANYGGETASIDLLMLNGRDFGHQSTRKIGFSAVFRQSYFAEHYFIGSANESYDSGSHFILAREPGNEKGLYTLYMLQADYNYVSVIVMNEVTPLSADINESTVLHMWNSTDLSDLDWQNDIVAWIQDNENVEVVYDTYRAPTATMSVGKIRYVEMEQIPSPSESDDVLD